MVSKSITEKADKMQYAKAIFLVLLLIYSIGLCSGCAFAFKNSDNLSFVEKVSGTAALVQNEKSSLLNLTLRFALRDLAAILIVLLLKYSGILRGASICVPFVIALQNSCIYLSCLMSKSLNILELLYFYVIKDTAIAFLILAYCYIIALDLIFKKQLIKQDIRKTAIYLCGICMVYMVDYGIKTLFMLL
ncbi:MAG: hypothetical protein RR198_04215 [Oscillospiraceae bacterium]